MMHAAHKVVSVLPGVLLALLLCLDQTAASPSTAAAADRTDLGTLNLLTARGGASALPHHPQSCSGAPGEVLDNEDDKDAPAKRAAGLPFDYALAAAAPVEHALPSPAASTNAFRLTPVYLLTERIRL